MTPTHKQPFLIRSLFTSKKHPNVKNGSNDIPTQFPTSQQLALSIPEILENILSFLSLESRQRALKLVCKQWYAVCKTVTPVNYNWIFHLTSSYNDNDNDDIDMMKRTIVERISSANNLIIKVDSSTPVTGASEQWLSSWATMMGVLSSIIQDHNDRGRHPRLRTIHLRAARRNPRELCYPITSAARPYYPVDSHNRFSRAVGHHSPVYHPQSMPQPRGTIRQTDIRCQFTFTSRLTE